MKLVTAERLKNLLETFKVDGQIHAPEGYAHKTNEGWMLTCGAMALRSARINEARCFQTLDALYNIARECGFTRVVVRVTPPSDKS